MRRAPAFVLALTALALLSAEAGPQATDPPMAEETAVASPCDRLPPADLNRICTSGRLRVARYGGQRPPFFFQNGDEWQGFDVDLAADVARRLGVEVEPRLAVSFDGVVDMVADGDADLAISKLSITLERSQRVRFSKPYMTVYQTLLINRLAAPKQDDPFTALNRPQVRTGALEGSSYIGYAEREFPLAEVVPHGEFTRMMFDVTESRLEAAFVDSARANTWRQDNPERLIQVRAFVARDRKDLLAFAVNWRDTHLLAWLDLYLDSIRDEGTALDVYRKWFVESAAE